jgi:GT2 family glycosyltransferase
VVRRETWERLGGFDERLWLFFNDVDFCRRLHALGAKIRYLARVEVLHHGGKSTSQYRDFTGEWIVNRLRYYRKHHGRVGAWVVKAWLLMRALEERARVRRNTTGLDREAAMRDLHRVVRRALAT